MLSRSQALDGLSYCAFYDFLALSHYRKPVPPPKHGSAQRNPPCTQIDTLADPFSLSRWWILFHCPYTLELAATGFGRNSQPLTFHGTRSKAYGGDKPRKPAVAYFFPPRPFGRY